MVVEGYLCPNIISFYFQIIHVPISNVNHRAGTSKTRRWINSDWWMAKRISFQRCFGFVIRGWAQNYVVDLGTMRTWSFGIWISGIDLKSRKWLKLFVVAKDTHSCCGQHVFFIAHILINFHFWSTIWLSIRFLRGRLDSFVYSLEFGS